jgi:hypothetical protein
VTRRSPRIRQKGRRTRDMFKRIRCPPRHGQSNASHFNMSTSRTRTIPFRGILLGTSSASRTDATMRHGLHGHQCHQLMGFMPTTFAPGMGWSFPNPSYQNSDCSNDLLTGLNDLSRFLAHACARGSRSVAARDRTQSVVPEIH